MNDCRFTGKIDSSSRGFYWVDDSIPIERVVDLFNLRGEKIKSLLDDLHEKDKIIDDLRAALNKIQGDKQ